MLSNISRLTRVKASGCPTTRLNGLSVSNTATTRVSSLVASRQQPCLGVATPFHSSANSSQGNYREKYEFDSGIERQPRKFNPDFRRGRDNVDVDASGRVDVSFGGGGSGGSRRPPRYQNNNKYGSSKPRQEKLPPDFYQGQPQESEEQVPRFKRPFTQQRHATADGPSEVPGALKSAAEQPALVFPAEPTFLSRSEARKHALAGKKEYIPGLPALNLGPRPPRVSKDQDPLAWLQAKLKLYGGASPRQASPFEIEEVWETYSNLRTSPDNLAQLDPSRFRGLCDLLKGSNEASNKTAYVEKGRREVETDIAGKSSAVKALERVKTVIQDMNSVGLVPDGRISWYLTAAAKLNLTTYKSVRAHLNFCVENKVPLISRNVVPLLNDLARHGNYTALLRVFHEMQQPPFDIKPDAFAWSTMLHGVVHARVNRSETNLGYPVGMGFIADLKLPQMYNRESYTSQKQKADTWAFDSHESVEPETPSSSSETSFTTVSMIDEPQPNLPLILANEPFPDDLCSPNMPASSITPIRKVLAIFKKTWETGWHNAESPARISSFNQAMFACSVMGRPALAIEFLRMMKSEPYNLEPDRFTYTALLHHCASSVRRNKPSPISPNLAATLGSPASMDVARVQRREAVKMAESIWEDMVSKGIKPNVVAFTTMIQIYCENEEPEKALHLLRLMRSVGEAPNSVTYSILINYLLEHDDTAGSLAIFRQMKDAGIRPGVFVYTSLISHFRSKRNLQAMEEVWEQMTSPGSQATPNAYTICSMAAEYGNRGQLDKMFHVISRLTPSDLAVDGAIWNAIMDGLQRSAMFSKTDPEIADAGEVAKAYYRLAKEIWKSRVERRPVEASAVPESLEKVFPLVGMVGPPVDMAATCVIVDAAGFLGSPEELDEVWKDAGTVVQEASGKRIESLPKNVALMDNTYAAYVEALCRLGRHEQAREFVMSGLSRADSNSGASQIGVRVASTLMAMWNLRSLRSDVILPGSTERKITLDELREEMETKFGSNFIAEVDRLLTEFQLVGVKGAMDRIRPAQMFNLPEAEKALKSGSGADVWLAKTQMTAPVIKTEQLLQEAKGVFDAPARYDRRRQRDNQQQRRVDKRAVVEQVEPEKEAEELLNMVETGGDKPAAGLPEMGEIEPITEDDLKQLRRSGPSSL